MRQRFYIVAVVLFLAASVAAQESADNEFARALTWKNIESLELSPDGQQLIYTTKEPEWNQNKFVKSIWVTSTTPGGTPVPLTAPDKSEDSRFPAQNGDSPRWSPDGTHIAFISTRDGTPQIWLIDRPSGTPTKLTSGEGAVLSFAWSPDGKKIAYVARSKQKGSFEAGRNSDKDAGIVIDKWNFVVYKLFNNSAFLQLDQRNELWVIDIATGKAALITPDVHVTGFAWSPDGDRIAAVFQASPGLTTQRTDVLVWSQASGTSQVILQGTGGESFDNATGYSNPIWSPKGDALAVLYRNNAKRWQTKSQLGIYRFDQKRYVPVPGADRIVLYVPRFMWLEPDKMLLENTAHGSRRLYEVSLTDSRLTPVGDHNGSESLHAFSHDGKTMVFVRESPTHQPEIYVSHAPFTSSTQLSQMNGSPTLPNFERIHWKSRDGVEVEGWLAKPADFDSKKKYPLLVIVHGGPGFAVPDAYEMFVEWPYPYRIAARKGYLVLFPNYRGTGSYSDTFSAPKDVAKEPADDVVTGVEFLIQQGFVDKNKIGIAGHSHGAWLGPVVLTENPKLFQAASFAEGGFDLISAYGQMPGWLNMNIHDYYYGGSPFGNLQRYIAMSPIFHVAGLTTPTLLEFGEQSLAVQGLEAETALWRCGVPSELVLYPRTGHNMSRPKQEAEAMQRNLDWFDYWLLGRKDSGKQDQYNRWAALPGKAQEQRTQHPCTAQH